MKTVRVWDLPTRLFHWLLVLSIIGLFVTGKIGGNWMDWHAKLGYLVLGLIVFRIVWGFVGNQHARFAGFVRGPAVVIAYLKGKAPAVLGHNPLGALSVLALIAIVGFQAVSGLFADDDILMRGPYANAVSGSVSAWFTKLHRLNSNVILGLVGLHLAAILFYTFVKRESLLKPMFTGEKSGEGAAFEAEIAEKARPAWAFWFIVALIAVLVWAVVTRQFG